jgi:hypothetical protein
MTTIKKTFPIRVSLSIMFHRQEEGEHMPMNTTTSQIEEGEGLVVGNIRNLIMQREAGTIKVGEAEQATKHIMTNIMSRKITREVKLGARKKATMIVKTT